MEKLLFTYKVGQKEYDVYVLYKRQRNTYFRFKDGAFHITTNKLVSQKTILKGLDKFGEKLINRNGARNNNYSFEEDFIYVLGEKYSLSSLGIKNSEELDDFLKKLSLTEITKLVRKNEEIMGISNPYKVAVRNTKTQYGSNSKQTRKLSFQISLVHFSPEIIETVVIHELAHDKVRNHQKAFYDIVIKYCPNYYLLQRKLKKGIHA